MSLLRWFKSHGRPTAVSSSDGYELRALAPLSCSVGISITCILCFKTCRRGQPHLRGAYSWLKSKDLQLQTSRLEAKACKHCCNLPHTKIPVEGKSSSAMGSSTMERKLNWEHQLTVCSSKSASLDIVSIQFDELISICCYLLFQLEASSKRTLFCLELSLLGLTLYLSVCLFLSLPPSIHVYLFMTICVWLPVYIICVCLCMSICVCLCLSLYVYVCYAYVCISMYIYLCLPR